MISLITIGLIIAVIFMAQEIHYLKKENEELRVTIKNLIEKQKREREEKIGEQNIENKTLQSNYDNINSQPQKIEQQKPTYVQLQSNRVEPSRVIKPQVQVDKFVVEEKIKKNKKEVKNSFILMTGAFLIVLAAIVFLLSMWDVISDIFKVSVLLLLMGVFLGASKVADKTFKLKNTANTFFYIAMAYIPVLALAIYLIRMSSGYLQSSHDQNVFWLIASLLMSLIYGGISCKSKRKPLMVGSLIMQVLSTIFGTCIFSNSFMTVIAAITGYNLILAIVDLYLKPKMFQNVIKIFNLVLSIILNLIVYFATIIQILFGMSYATIIALLIETVISLIYARKTDKIWHIVMFIIGAFATILAAVNLEEIYVLIYGYKQIIMLVTTTILFVLGMCVNWDKFKAVTKVTTYIFLGLLYISTLNSVGIDGYIVLFVATAISLLMIKLDSKYSNEYLHTSINLFIFAGLNFVWCMDMHFTHLIFLVPIILFVISFFTDEKTSKTLKIYTNISAILSILVKNIMVVSPDVAEVSRCSLYSVIMIAVVEALYIFDFAKYKNKISQLFFVIVLNALLYDLMLVIGISEYSIYIFFATSLAALLIKKNKYVSVYAIVAQLLSMLILIYDITLIKLIVNIVTTMLICYNARKLNLSEEINLIPLLLLIPNIYFSKLGIIQDYNVMQIVSILLILIMSLLSIKDKKINIYTFLSYIYLFMQVLCFDINKYINIIILAIISMLQMLSYTGNTKNVVKTIWYLSILILYNTIVHDLNAQMISVLLFGYIVILCAITRTVVAKNNLDTCKVIEYIGYGLLFLIALYNYIDILDAMLFMTILIGIIIFTYLKRFGPIFLCSIIAEILIAFSVTEDFWTSIPWWIYLLSVGGGLIAFAVRNEVKEKKEGKTLKDTMKQISNKLDL